MATVGLAVGEIDDVAEDAAHRCTRRVQDPQRFIRRGHAQNLPSPTRAAIRMQPDRTGAAIRQQTAASAPGMGQPSGKILIPIKDFHG
jgi:hypothetical protein